MHIATWNLARPVPGRRREGALLDHMARVDADVWALTETHLALAPGDGFRLVATSSPAPDRTPDERWTAIWARADLVADVIETSDPERTACARLREEHGQALYVYGTVLPWLSDERRVPLRGAEAFAAALEAQASDWCRLRSDDPRAVLCVAGDLNQDLLPTGHYYGSAAGRARLRGALQRAGLVCLTGEDRDPVARLGGARASIDHVCVAGLGDSVEGAIHTAVVWPTSAEVGSQLSDHHGVAIKLW